MNLNLFDLLGLLKDFWLIRPHWNLCDHIRAFFAARCQALDICNLHVYLGNVCQTVCLFFPYRNISLCFVFVIWIYACIILLIVRSGKYELCVSFLSYLLIKVFVCRYFFLQLWCWCWLVFELKLTHVFTVPNRMLQ